MTTASCDNMSTFPDATEPKSVEEKRKQPNGTVEIYESLKQRKKLYAFNNKKKNIFFQIDTEKV